MNFQNKQIPACLILARKLPVLQYQQSLNLQCTDSQVSIAVDSDDEEDEDTHFEFKRPPTKYRNKLKMRPSLSTVIASDSEGSDWDATVTTQNSDIEVIENPVPVESPEEELGELFKRHTYRRLLT